jgi:ankyrin repeat protein
MNLAIETGDLDVIHALLQKAGDSVLEIDESSLSNRNTYMHWAAKFGHVDVVDKLKDAGLSTSAENAKGETPMHWAAKHGNGAVIEALSLLGANPSSRSNDGSTPLHYAAAAGTMEAVKMLITRGALVSLADNQWATPMHLATSSKCPESGEVIKLLRDAGADVMVFDKEGRTPLARAQSEGCAVAILALKAPEKQQVLSGDAEEIPGGIKTDEIEDELSKMIKKVWVRP